MPKPRTIKIAQQGTTFIELPDGSTKTVTALLDELEQAKKVSRVDGVEYDHPCQCNGSIHERGMGCW